ncbi:MAG: hypothetical protein GYA36_22710, partial [Veillonellaceae bacterium]|nr:hypothetical protein [Veillonellaceae bacterium]
YSGYGAGMDFLAPGGSAGEEPVGIYTCEAYPNNTYAWVSGTSLSAPIVTATISLIHDYSNLVMSDDFENIMKASCDDIYENGYDDISGWGSVNAEAALSLVKFPNEVFAYQQSNAEPSLVSQSSWYQIHCTGWSGLMDGDYSVRRSEYRWTVNFANDLPKHFDHTPIMAWGLGQFSGIRDENPNYYIPYCELVNGTLSNTGATFKTFIFDVKSVDQSIDYGTFPNGDWQTMYYSVIGDACPAKPVGLQVTSSADYHPKVLWTLNA